MSEQNTVSHPPPLIRFFSQSIFIPLVLHPLFLCVSESHYQADPSLPDQYPTVDQEWEKGGRRIQLKERESEQQAEALFRRR